MTVPIQHASVSRSLLLRLLFVFRLLHIGIQSPRQYCPRVAANAGGVLCVAFPFLYSFYCGGRVDYWRFRPVPWARPLPTPGRGPGHSQPHPCKFRAPCSFPFSQHRHNDVRLLVHIFFYGCLRYASRRLMVGPRTAFAQICLASGVLSAPTCLGLTYARQFRDWLSVLSQSLHIFLDIL